MSQVRKPLRVDIRVLNRPHIVAAYGDDAAEAVQSAMVEAVSHYLLGGAVIQEMIGVQPTVPGLTPVRRIADDVIAIDLKACLPPVDISLLTEGLSRALILQPVTWGDDRIHVVPSVWPSEVLTANVPNDGDGVVLNPVESRPPFGGDPVPNGSGWESRYRRDMAAAARLLKDLAGDEVRLACQPIRMAGRSESLLYSECLLRVPQTGEVLRQVGLEIVAMERLGLIRGLDNHMLWRAIDCLQSDPELRLGVNISAQSACRDGWWAALEHRLEAERELAQRLTIEITETSAIPSIPAAAAFVDRMRMLGCKIAQDDFGAGRDAIRNLYALRPDIVKVDAFFLRQARQSAKGQEALRSLVGLARAIGGTVVIEGVETQVDSDAAIAAGAAWQQGHFIDPPRQETLEEGREPIAEAPRAFGRRMTPPLSSAVDSRMPAVRSPAAEVMPIQTHFELRWLRWAIPAATVAWALLSGGVWFVWRVSS
ncbi:EAL domain-containing protein [Rhizobium mesoamericanum]|uniref:EAL domain-containing protein n=1 Tax=Rhizobium mesoamericanum TaxID=1079800 RepID=UPI000423F1C3|nr:EAL domain-containing protein [Rhizobium mesoamericanum]